MSPPGTRQSTGTSAFSPPASSAGSASASASTSTGTISDALHRLRSAQKKTPGAPGYSRYVNRPIGRYLAAMAYRLGLGPNQVTGLSGAFSFVGIALIALVRPAWWSAAAVCGCLVLGYALDSADGQLARLRGGGSRVGEWFDHMVDVTKISCLHLAVLISVYRFDRASDAYLLVPLVYAVAANVWFFGIMLMDQLRRRDGRPPAGTIADARPGLRALLVLPTDYGVVCLMFALLATPAFRGVYAFFAAFNVCFTLASVYRWNRELRRADVDAATPP